MFFAYSNIFRNISKNNTVQTDIYLYPGYLVKEKGKLFWFSMEPKYNFGWSKEIMSTEVTSCIFDPWPYSEGGKEFIMKLGK